MAPIAVTRVQIAMRIGLFGGTFNPIHRCHLEAANQSRRRLRLDCILFIPSGDPPHNQCIARPSYPSPGNGAFSHSGSSGLQTVRGGNASADQIVLHRYRARTAKRVWTGGGTLFHHWLGCLFRATYLEAGPGAFTRLPLYRSGAPRLDLPLSH